MEYSVLSDVYEKLESTSAKLKKTDILAELFSKTPPELLPKVVLLSIGRVFPSYSQAELGVATQLMLRAISKATGFSTRKLEEMFKETGDLGLTIEKCIKDKKQTILFKKPLTVEKVFDNLQKIAFATGAGSQERKLNLIAELLVSAKPEEARYIVRTVLGELRIGVAEGIVRDAIAKAFNVDAKLVETAWNRLPDYGEIAKVARERGNAGLKKVKLEVGKPIQVLLAEKAPNLEEAMEKFENVGIEWKYDGARCQIHKKDDHIWLYTRRLEDVTNQFPDLVKLAKKGLKVKECIVEGEILGINPKTGKPLPFQKLSQRIQRKYDIDEMIKKIPIQINLFDVVYVDGKMLFDEPLRKRREILERIVDVIPGKFQLAEQLITKDLKKAEKFYRDALEAGQEGVMVKNLDSKYQPGRRVGYWLKVKPLMETLDLVIIGAEWGTGKRARWLSSYILACRDPDTGKFLSCGMMGTGLTEEQFQKMTDTLKPLIIEEKGRSVKIKPKVVVEVGYEEIQKSPNYESGYALRFPRLIRDRTMDKGPEEADTIERVEELFKSQGKVG
jgi:DNA ligase-1